MAKKKENTNKEGEVEIIDTPNIENVVSVCEEKVEEPKDKLKSLSIIELINFEKAASLICRRYENNIKMYDGSIRQNGREYDRYKKINELHSSILNEIELRLDNLGQ